MLMRLLIALVLVSCAPARAGRPCPAPPAPSADEFASCGGMLYHTPSGDAVRYTIKVKNNVGATLKDVCVLLDGAPLFTASQIESSPKDVKWDGRISYAHHRVLVQFVYQVKDQTVAVRGAKEIAAIDGGELLIDAFEHENKPALKITLPKDTPEPKCEH